MRELWLARLTFRMKPGVSIMVRLGQKAYLQQHTGLLFLCVCMQGVASHLLLEPHKPWLRSKSIKLDTLYKAVRASAHSARITMGLEETVVPSALKCFSVRSLMRSATALSGMMGGPYSSESSS